MTAPRLYLNEDVDPLLARILTQRGFDVLTTQDAGQRSAIDADQLAFAARTGRALMTHNVAHFAALARQYGEAGGAHHGVIVSDQLPLKELLARTLRLLDRLDGDAVRNQIVWLQDFKESVPDLAPER